MRRITYSLLFICLLLSACKSNNDKEDRQTEAENNFSISLDIEIEASTSKVWAIITEPEYAKTLGNEFDQNAYLESDWKLGSEVHFKYEPDQTVATGIIGQLKEERLIQIDYDFDGVAYVERFILRKEQDNTSLQVFAGPYGSDFAAQQVVWGDWLLKVKELSEAN